MREKTVTTRESHGGMCRTREKIASLLAMIAVAFSAHATTIVDVADGATVDIAASEYNGHAGGTAYTVSTADYALRFGKDVTVKLDPSAATDGVFTLFTNIYATNGNFTVDATGIDVIHWVGGVQTSGKVTVKGAKEIQFGEVMKLSSPNGKTNLAYFNTDVEFENAEAIGLVFTNAVTCAQLPTSCAWSVASGTRFAVDAYGLLGGGEATFALTDYDITLIETKGIAAGEIIVPADRTLEIRQCSRITFSATSGRWTWSGQGRNHVTNDITFVAGSAFYVDGGQGNLYFDGVLAGETSFTAAITSSDPISFTSSVSLSGTLSINNKTTFNLSGEGPFSFGDVTSASADNAITGGNGRILSCESLAANSVIGIGAGLDFRLGAVGAGATVNLLGEGPWSVTGPSSGNPLELSGVLVPEASGGALSVGGLVSLGAVGTSYSALTLISGAVLTNTTFDASVVLSGSGTLAPSGKDWKDKVALWADSSDTNSFVYVGDECGDWSDPSKTVYNSRTLISQWKDCRADHDVYRFRNTRYNESATLSSRSATVYPLDESAEPFGLNGYHTVSMWNNGSSSSRRINIVGSGNVNSQSPIEAAYAIMVFGGQSGGGAALLATSDGYFGRKFGNDTSNAGEGASEPISSNKVFSVHINGEDAASSTEVGLSNGWQIVSMNAMNQKIYGLGALSLGTGNGNSSTANTAGFQRYAEVMLFTEPPTELERMYAEEYLAAKWGLPCAHSGTMKAAAYTFALKPAPSENAILGCPSDSIPHSVTVNLSFSSRPAPGAYALLSNANLGAWSIGTVSGVAADRVSLVYDAAAKALYAVVTPRGLVITVE